MPGHVITLWQTTNGRTNMRRMSANITLSSVCEQKKAPWMPTCLFLTGEYWVCSLFVCWIASRGRALYGIRGGVRLLLGRGDWHARGAWQPACFRQPCWPCNRCHRYRSISITVRRGKSMKWTQQSDGLRWTRKSFRQIIPLYVSTINNDDYRELDNNNTATLW